MAKAMGGDMVLQLLHEFREMQEEAEEQYARTQKTLRTLRMKCRVVYRKTRVFADQVRAFSQDVDGFRDNMGEFVTHLSTLAKEVDGIKLNQTKMFGQMGRALNHLADAQSTDRKRIDVLEDRMDGPGEN
jgi:predicted RNase H-like nuclease (RuvC/YqgF family)